MIPPKSCGSLTLTVVPSEAKAQGEITIDVELQRPHPVLWLNADEVSVSRASVADAGIAVTLVKGNDQFLGLAFEPALTAGTHRLTLTFDNARVLSCPLKDCYYLVLVVDHDPSTLQLIRTCLEDFCHIAVARDCGEALEQVHSVRPSWSCSARASTSGTSSSSPRVWQMPDWTRSRCS